MPSKKDACTKLGRQRSDRKVRQKLDIAWYGGLEGEPVARSTVQNDALFASKTCFKDLLKKKKESETKCRRSLEDPQRKNTVNLDADNVCNT